MPNGTGMEGHAFTDSEVHDLRKKVEKLETQLKLIDGSQDKMLADRAAKYGPFDKHAVTVEAFWRIAINGHNAEALEDVHKEGLRMIFHKIGRIVTGDPRYPDSWDDIAGYAKRVADYNRTNKTQPAAQPKEKYNPSMPLPKTEGEKNPDGSFK